MFALHSILVSQTRQASWHYLQVPILVFWSRRDTKRSLGGLRMASGVSWYVNNGAARRSAAGLLTVMSPAVLEIHTHMPVDAGGWPASLCSKERLMPVTAGSDLHRWPFCPCAAETRDLYRYFAI